MEKISRDQAKELLANKKPFLLEEVMKLKDGEVLFIPSSEWHHKSHPVAYTKNWNKRHGLTLWAESVEEGYLIGAGDKPK